MRRKARKARNVTEGYNGVRLTLARYLAREFQLGAVIRTALDFFLGREMRDEVTRTGRRGAAADPSRATP